MSESSRAFVAILALIVLAVPHAVNAQDTTDVLRVTVDKSATLRIDRAASVVMVGQPEIADVAVESPRLIFVLGRKVGETNLVVLDAQGNNLVNVAVVVVPEPERTVTIYRGTPGVSTLSCDPRCSGTRNPGTEREPGQQGAGASGGGQTATPRQPTPTSGAASGAATGGASAPPATQSSAGMSGGPSGDGR